MKIEIKSVVGAVSAPTSGAIMIATCDYELWVNDKRYGNRMNKDQAKTLIDLLVNVLGDDERLKVETAI